MPSEFVPDRALLNPKFEGYKLDLLETDHSVASFPLPGQGATQSTIKTSSQPFSQPSFQEVRNRIRFNHLASGYVGSQAGYVDKSGALILVSYAFSTNTPSFYKVFEIPPLLESGSTDNANNSPEYPCAKALSATTWLVSDGSGRLFLVTLSGNASEDNLDGRIAGYAEITISSSSSNELSPFWLYEASLIEQNEQSTSVRIVTATKVHPAVSSEPTPATPRSKKTPKWRYHLAASRIDFANPIEGGDPLASPPSKPTPLWSVFGDDLPLTLSTSPSENHFITFSSSHYHPSLEPQPTHRRDPLPDEIAPIPRAGENLDAPLPPLYSWNQMGDSLTVAFFLPASTPKTHIRITLAAKHLSLHIIDPPADSSSSDPDPEKKTPALRLPFFERREWWDGIDASASFWTWEKEGERRDSEEEELMEIDGEGVRKEKEHWVGVLTLYLEKAHEDTRWTHLFSETHTRIAKPGSTEDVNDNDVPETLDPTQLLAAREALEKYTSALTEGQDASGLGLGAGVPSLARQEVDDEVDEDVGNHVVCTLLDKDKGLDGTAERTENGWPVEVLSLPISTPAASSASSEWSVIVRQDIDGLLYSRTSTPSSSPSWTHSATFPALSFVLASKRDTRFVVHVGSKAVLAFESGSGGAGAGTGNVYLYRGVPGKTVWGKQAVLKVSGGSAGSLLGVVALTEEGTGKMVIAALCENELVLLKNVL